MSASETAAIPPAPASSRRRALVCLIAGLAALAAYVAVRFLAEKPISPALVLLPAPLFIGFLAAFVRMVRGMDELERRIQLEALAFAYPALLVLLMTLGLLELSGVAVSSADWSFRHLWQMAVVLYAAGMTIASRRYAFR